MGLGNSSGQTGSRRKGHLVKRIKEVTNARDYHDLSGSTVESGDAAACALGSAGGYTTGTYVYTSRRAYDKHYLPNGYYKVSHDGSTFKSIQISSGQIASTPSTCR